MALPVPSIQAGESVGRRHGLSGARIPPHALAVLEALRFDGGGSGRLSSLEDADFRKVLEFCDPAQLTLTLNHLCRDALPGWVQARIDQNVRDYSQRFDRLQASLCEIADMLESRGIEFVVLKGFAHSPDFTPDPLLRVQGDIDIWCSPESVLAARDAMLELGYLPLCTSEGRHLPPMIRQSQWQWRGDYFASDLPIAVELHYQLWDEQAESIRAPGEQEFWKRRVTASLDGRQLPVLSTPDTLGFASLHLLMHVLHGDLRLQRAWEIANFLDTRAFDDTFWSWWRQCHSDSLRRLEAIIFRLVSDWFGCRLAAAVEEEIDSLPGDVGLWIERYALSPVEALFHPKKDEIWLQLCLVESLRDKCAILLRRIFPVRVPARVDEGTLGHALPTPAQIKRHLLFVGSRVVHHSRALFPVLLGGARWYWTRTRLGGGFLRFQAASVLFDLGMSIFFLLYNLYLLGLGFHENVLGQVSSLMSLGTLLGALPAAAITRRVGLRNTLLIAILGGAAAAFLRALNAGEAWLYATALLNGVFLSLWAVSYSPAIAGLSNARNRQFAFSLTCAAGMSIGILGGLVGGRLPGVLQYAMRASGSLQAKRTALLIASAFASLAALPAAGLRFAPVARAETKIYPSSRFLRRFLVSLWCWSLAVGAFNPFFNAFFSERLGMGVERIGLVFSCSHLVQVVAVLSAPMILRRMGETKGIASMQFVTALALAFLALSPAGGIAATVYVGYMSFQYMSEPGLFNMLMNRVAPGERSGASALYFLVTSIAGSVAAFAAGAAISRFGYPATLMTSGLVAAVAALLFGRLIHEEACAITSATSC